MPTYRSLYPSSSEEIQGEFYPFRTGKASFDQPRSKQAGNTLETYGHLRKRVPSNVALPGTLKWANELPARVKPVTLMQQFPRIANLIAAAWEDLLQFEIYMDSLLTDKRGGRKGFGADVITELGALDIYRHTVRECAPPPIPWSDVGRRG